MKEKHKKNCLKFQISEMKEIFLLLLISLALINGFICTTCITVSNAINIFLKDIPSFLPHHAISLFLSRFYFISCKAHKENEIERKKSSEGKNLFTLILFIKYRERNCKAIELIHITLTLYRRRSRVNDDGGIKRKFSDEK